MTVSIIKGLIAGAAAAVVLTACGPTAGSDNCTSKGTSSGTAVKPVKVVSDSQTTGAYDSKTVTVDTGESVAWDWQDQGNPHSVTADKGSFDSCLQNSGYTFVLTFTEPGTYAYHCSIHSQMTGRIVVT